MRNVFRSLAAVLALGLAAGSDVALAADANGNFTIRGVGQETCQSFLTGIADPAGSARYISWLMGYVTAENRLLKDTYDLLPTLDGIDFVRTVGLVCRSRPQENLAIAANNTLAALAPLRQATETPLVTMASRGKSIQVRQGMVQALQGGLAAKGLYKGERTGQPSADLTKAIEALQQREKLAVTGLPDIDTLIRAVVKQ